MPNCFTLTRKGEAKPASLNAIDEELCQHLGVPVHPKQYVAGWYMSIGFSLACGKDWDYIESTLQQYADEGDEADKQALACCKYLRENFTADAWCER